MPLNLTLTLGAMAMLCAPASAAPAPGSPSASDPDKKARTERLAGLGRLWGTVKYFHPFLACKDIDWDAALVRAIPRVREAGTPDAYLAAINAMLDELGDPETHAAIGPAQSDSSADGIPPDGDGAAWRMAGGVAILDCKRGARAEYDHAMPSAEQLADVKGVVVDCRGTSSVSAYHVVPYLCRLVGDLADRPVTLGTYRFREHRGFPIAVTSGGYRSSLATNVPAVWLGGRKSPAPPLAFIIDAAATLRPILSGLQAAGLATVVRQTGTAAAPKDREVPSVELPDGIVARVRTVEFVGAGGEPDLRPDVEVHAPATPADDPALEAALKSLFLPRPAPRPAALQGQAQGQVDKPYAEMEFPDAEYRLLSLFRFWNAMHYFFPYKELMDRPWPEALAEFIPRFEESRDALDYQRAVIEVAVRLQDSHVSVSGARVVADRWGMFAPPVTVASVEGKTVITRLLDAHAAEAFKLQRGDIVVAVDGEPVEQSRARWEPVLAASTPQSLRNKIDARLLRGAKDSVARLRVQGDDGAMRDVDIPRTHDWFSAGSAPPRTAPATYEILPSGYGYIDLERLRYEDADAALDAVMETPALIFDMRGYPNGTAWAVAPRLAPEGKTIIGAHFRAPFWTGRDVGDEDTDGNQRVLFNQPLPRSGKRRYHGKVVMLINEQAMSQAEHTCLFFAAATDVTFIGSATAGANGDVTAVTLPGNLLVTFTGQEVRWPDGRQLQRVGVKPHVEVAPTVKGIREGRDEVLEAAVAFLQQKLKR